MWPESALWNVVEPLLSFHANVCVFVCCDNIVRIDVANVRIQWMKRWTLPLSSIDCAIFFLASRVCHLFFNWISLAMALIELDCALAYSSFVCTQTRRQLAAFLSPFPFSYAIEERLINSAWGRTRCWYSTFLLTNSMSVLCCHCFLFFLMRLLSVFYLLSNWRITGHEKV